MRSLLPFPQYNLSYINPCTHCFYNVCRGLFSYSFFHCFITLSNLCSSPKRTSQSFFSINSFFKKTLLFPWANTSSNTLAGELIRQGPSDMKIAVEDLLTGNIITTALDEEIIYNRLSDSNGSL